MGMADDRRNAPDFAALAQRMADAIQQQRASRRASVVGRDGRSRYTCQQLLADLVLDAAERAFREALDQPYEALPPLMTEMEAVRALAAQREEGRNARD